jgi:hypothetical protein
MHAYKQGQLDLDKKAVFAKQSVGILTSFFSKTKQAIEAAAALKAKVADFFKTKKRHTICSRTHHPTGRTSQHAVILNLNFAFVPRSVLQADRY